MRGAFPSGNAPPRQPARNPQERETPQKAAKKIERDDWMRGVFPSGNAPRASQPAPPQDDRKTGKPRALEESR